MADIESAYAQLDHAHSTIRQLLQQRKDLRKERDAAFEEGARSMRERAALAVEEAVMGTYEALDAVEAVRALPLLPGGDATETPVRESPQELAEELDRLREENENVRAALLERMAADGKALKAAPAEDFDSGWAAGHAHARADEARIAELEKQVADLSDLAHGHGEDIARLNTTDVDPDTDVSRALNATRKTRPYNAWTDG